MSKLFTRRRLLIELACQGITPLKQPLGLHGQFLGRSKDIGDVRVLIQQVTSGKGQGTGAERAADEKAASGEKLAHDFWPFSWIA